MKTIRFAHLDSAMRIVLEPDRASAAEEIAGNAPHPDAQPQPGRDVSPDARAAEVRAAGERRIRQR